MTGKDTTPNPNSKENSNKKTREEYQVEKCLQEGKLAYLIAEQLIETDINKVSQPTQETIDQYKSTDLNSREGFSHYSEEDMILYRMNKMAGLGE